MKFYMKLPGGVEIKFKREPMSYERFCMIVWTVWIFMIGSGFIEFFRMAGRK